MCIRDRNYIDDHFVKVKRDVAPLILCPTEYNKSWTDVELSLIHIYHDELPDDALLCPMIDARRMEVYAAIYDRALKSVRDIAADIVDEWQKYKSSFRPFLSSSFQINLSRYQHS